jgi:hypothetical protein
MAAAKENIVIDVTVDTGDATKSISGIENRIEELTSQRNELQIGTEAFEKVSREIQGLEQDIKGVELQFEALDMEQKMTAGTDAVVGLAGGFVAAQGAASLFGIESENLEKSLQKMAAAMSISMGLRDMANGVIALRKLGGASALARKGIIALNNAMKANPWGALLAAVVAVGAAVAVFVVNSRNAAKALDVQHQKSLLLNEARKESAKAIVQEKQNLESLVKAAKDETLSKEARQEAIKQINEISPEYLGNITSETINSEDATIAINKYTAAIERKARAQAMSQKMADLEAQILDEQMKSQKNLQEQGQGFWNSQIVMWRNAKQIFTEDVKDWKMMQQLQMEVGAEQSESAVAGLNAQKEALKQLMTAEQGALLEDEAFVRVRGKQIAATQALAEEQAALEEEMKKEALAIKEINNEKWKSINQFFDIGQDAYAKEIENIEELTAALTRESELRAEKAKGVVGVQKENADAVKDIWMNVWAEMAAMDNERTEQEIANRQRIIDITNEGLESAQNSINMLSALNEASSLKRISEIDSQTQAQVQGLEEGDSRRKAIEKAAEKRKLEIQKKEFERGKKIQIAQAIMSGLQGVVNIWSASTTIPQPYDAILRAINTAALIATTAAQISKIKSTPFGGGGSVSGGGAGASAGAGGVPIGNISNTASLVDQQQQEITAKVVVVESDITTTQENVATVSEVSTF